MKKSEFIERYGLEAYKAHNERNKERNRERYANDSEFREAHLNYNKERYANDPEYREAYKAKLKDNSRNYYARNKNKCIERQKEYQRLKKENDVDWYKIHKADCCRRNTLRYSNDEEYRARHIEFATWSNKKRYVEGGKVELIEKYELAKANGFKGWDIHHRLELHPDCSLRFTKKSLVKLGLYYNRPPNELIWIDRTEHHKIHNESRRMNKRI